MTPGTCCDPGQPLRSLMVTHRKAALQLGPHRSLDGTDSQAVSSEAKQMRTHESRPDDVPVAYPIGW